VSYHSVTVAGDVLVLIVHGHLGSLVKAACVDFERDESQGNPIVAYLQRHGSANSVPVPLITDYHLTSDSNPSLYRAPSTSEPYSKVSGDFNSIHTNPLLCRLFLLTRYLYACSLEPLLDGMCRIHLLDPSHGCN
jgi:fatty acid synthase subunit alpha, fungi type